MMRFLIPVSLGLVVASAGVANAGPPASEPAGAGAVDERDPESATTVALGGALVPIAMTLVGLDRDNETLIVSGLAAGIVTPAVGHFYGGKYLTYGMAARAAGLALMVEGWQRFHFVFCDDSCGSQTSARVMLLGGLASYLGGTIYDVATTSRSVREHNRRVTVSPNVLSTQSGPAYGFSLDLAL